MERDFVTLTPAQRFMKLSRRSENTDNRALT